MMLDRYVACADIRNHCWYEQWGNPFAGRIFDHFLGLSVLSLEASDSRTDIDSKPERVDVLLLAFCVKAGLLHCLIGSCDAVKSEFVLFTNECLVHSVVLRSEILNLASNSDRKIVCRKIIDEINAADAIAKIFPVCLQIISYRRDDAHSSYDYSFIHVVKGFSDSSDCKFNNILWFTILLQPRQREDLRQKR